MGTFSNAVETQVLQSLVSTTVPTRSSTLAFALLTAPADDTSTGQLSTTNGTEVANSAGYARVAFNPGDSNWTVSGNTATNAVAIVFPQATGSWGTITDVMLTTSATYDSGTSVVYGTLAASKGIATGDVFQFPAGSFTITLD